MRLNVAFKCTIEWYICGCHSVQVAYSEKLVFWSIWHGSCLKHWSPQPHQLMSFRVDSSKRGNFWNCISIWQGSCAKSGRDFASASLVPSAGNTVEANLAERWAVLTSLNKVVSSCFLSLLITQLLLHTFKNVDSFQAISSACKGDHFWLGAGVQYQLQCHW